MVIEIRKDSKIYVAAPAGVATGGPELLHQLVYHLTNSFNFDAYMFYYPSSHPNPIHENYIIYKNKYTDKIIDNHDNILICPETYKGLSLFGNYKKIRKILWWLGVDNFYNSKLTSTSIAYNLLKIMEYFLKNKINISIPIEFSSIIIKIAKNKNTIKDPYVEMADYHLVQSQYAFNHLISRNININKIYYLSDYLYDDFLKESYNLNDKQDFVIYNPKKGMNFTLKIIKRAKNIRFIPIVNMKRGEVINILKKGKVYIDFGHHPGKDRMPREAAILGCCVIVSKEGSALTDIPIPEEYKFERKNKEIENIISKIKDCIQNYDYHIKYFDKYREIIKNEPKKFISDLKLIFKKEI